MSPNQYMKTTMVYGLSGLFFLVLLGCNSNTDDANVFENNEQSLSVNVGKACIPDDEEFASFSGYGKDEVNVQRNNTDSCEGGPCVAYLFRGRVTCPDGFDPTAKDSSPCLTAKGEPITVAVPPQLPDRPASQYVTCSCVCGGPEESGPFCECPSGFSCEAFDLLSTAPLSYCVRK